MVHCIPSPYKRNCNRGQQAVEVGIDDHPGADQGAAVEIVEPGLFHCHLDHERRDDQQRDQAIASLSAQLP